MLVIGVTNVVAVIVVSQLQSNIATVGIIVLLAIQAVLVAFLIRRYSHLQLSTALKE